MAIISEHKTLVAVGLNDIEKRIVDAGFEEEIRIMHLSSGKMLEGLADAKGRGAVLIIPCRVWKHLPEERREIILDNHEAYKVLIVDKNQENSQAEIAYKQGFSDVITAPLTREKIADVMEKASQVGDLFDDIMRMAKEISLEREILARKTDALLFLNRIMTRAVESLNPVTILNKAREDLNLLLPVRAMQGIFWQNSGKNAVEAEIFLAFHKNPAVQDNWLELHLEKARSISGREVQGFQLTYLMDSESGEETADLELEENKTVVLPLKAGGEYFGCLTLLSGESLKLSRDQSEVLRSATNHLGLALKNALLFRETKIRADYDGLTRIYNRHYFDDRLSEELSRQKRYQHDLSLMLLDLDHFKQVNDSYGHQAGDHVLKEVGQILLDGIRSTDFAARYGGEEFVVILPHIAEEQARILGERIRHKIAAHHFEFQGLSFNVTASLGIACLDAKSAETGQELMRRADQALYQAKAEGRDRVLTFTDLMSGVNSKAAEQI